LLDEPVAWQIRTFSGGAAVRDGRAERDGAHG
jgi:hypothetical protein